MGEALETMGTLLVCVGGVALALVLAVAGGTIITAILSGAFDWFKKGGNK